MEIILRIGAFLLGAAIVAGTTMSAIRTFVLPRSANVLLTRVVFDMTWYLFDFRARKATTYEERDGIMALYAPLTLLVLPVVWLMCVCVGYMEMFWAIGVEPLFEAFKMSGSSLLTLGFALTDGFAQTVLAFSEATLGLILIAVLIAYLPTMYSAFSKREEAVSLLEVRAGSPPSAVEMISRIHRIGAWDALHDLWEQWEIWFVDLEESHTSLAALVFFRSPEPHRSWITAAGAVLDAAAITASTLDVPRDAQTDLCIRAGYLALRRIADFFRIPYSTDPKAGDAISISRQEFDEVYDQLAMIGVPLKADREQAWCDFAGWRVNYDTVLLELADLTMAPYAPWSSDRGVRRPAR